MFCRRSFDKRWQYIFIASRASEHQKVESAILRYLYGYPHDEKSIFAVRLAVEEAVMNAIKHGNAGDPSKQVNVKFTVNGNDAIFVIEDQGHGFNHEHLPDCTVDERIELPHGRGILLMRSYMDDVRYSEKGNVVTLVKELPCNPEPPC